MSTLQSKSSFTGVGAWEREFGSLREYNMEHMFLMLLSMAKNSHQLRSLHDRLPENCRLLRDDLIRLEAFWQKYLSKRSTSGVVDSFGDADASRWLIEQSRDGHTLIEYYRKKLLDLGKQPRRDYVNGGLEGDKLGQSWFATKLFGKEAGVVGHCYHLGFRVHELYLEFSLRPDDSVLTEELTFQLLTKLPEYEVRVEQRAKRTSLIYSMPAGKMKPSTKSWRENDWEDGSIMAGSQYGHHEHDRRIDHHRVNSDILSRITKRCIEMGIPIEGGIVEIPGPF